jgi:hypothetical protein
MTVYLKSNGCWAIFFSFFHLDVMSHGSLLFPQGKETVKQRPFVDRRDSEVAEESSVVDVIGAVRLEFVLLLSPTGQRDAEAERFPLAVVHRHFSDAQSLENPPDHQEHVRVAANAESL